VDELSPEVRTVLAGLVGAALSPSEGLPGPYRGAVMSMVREALASVDRKLQNELEQAQANGIEEGNL
jgi:hypothetical protein